jgi:DNA-binding Lrp family transcriptional regulator
MSDNFIDGDVSHMSEMKYQLDRLDMQILSELLNNCRKSARQIGEKIGIASGTVNAKIRKMRRNGIILDFMIKVDPPTLEHSIIYVMVSGQNMEEILAHMRSMGELFMIAPCVGGFTVCGVIVRGGMQEKIELAERKNGVRVLSFFEPKHSVSSRFTKIDMQIVREMLINPREKIDIIAKKTGLSTKTISRCIDRLHGDDGIHFTVDYDPTKIRGFITHAILIQVTGETKPMFGKLAHMFSRNFLEVPFLMEKQIVLFLYSDDIYEMDETMQSIREMPGVKSVDLFIARSTKYSQEWMLDNIRKAETSPTLHLEQQWAENTVPATSSAPRTFSNLRTF